jgi:hypothetical protein
MCLGNGAYAVHPAVPGNTGSTAAGPAGSSSNTGGAGRSGAGRSGPIVWVGTSSDIILGLSLQQVGTGHTSCLLQVTLLITNHLLCPAQLICHPGSAVRSANNATFLPEQDGVASVDVLSSLSLYVAHSLHLCSELIQQASGGADEGASVRGAGMTAAAVAAAAAGAVHVNPGAALAARQKADASKALAGTGGMCRVTLCFCTNCYINKPDGATAALCARRSSFPSACYIGAELQYLALACSMGQVSIYKL